MESIREWEFQKLPVIEYKRSLHRSKNYYNIINALKGVQIEKYPIEAALKFLLTSDMLPPQERQNIRGFTIFHEDSMIALHCLWAPTIFTKRDDIFRVIGWYPYVTGVDLGKSDISQGTDAWLNDRNFNGLEFPTFEVNKITLRDISAGNGNGTAIMLNLDGFKILLDCCRDLEEASGWDPQEKPNLLFLSHAHKDHYSSLDLFVSQFDSIPLILSHTTLDLLMYFTQNSPGIGQYLQRNAYPLIFDDVYFINSNITLQILKAGHYPGAAMLYIITPHHKILFTGDTSLYDLQPLKGGAGGIHNLNGPVNTLILDGQFCNTYFPSQKYFLDLACERALETLQKGGPVVVFGDPGSWLLIFYLKFFYYLSQHNKKYRVYLDSHTLEIMKILRYRYEDMTASLSQRILRFHDPFGSVMKQDLSTFDFKNHSVEDPPIILFDSNTYSDPPDRIQAEIFNNPYALLIVTGPIRADSPLQQLWTKLTSHKGQKHVLCHLFGKTDKLKYPPFCLHADRTQTYEIFRHLMPQNVFLFHNDKYYLLNFKSRFYDRNQNEYPHTKVEVLEPTTEFCLYKI